MIGEDFKTSTAYAFRVPLRNSAGALQTGQSPAVAVYLPDNSADGSPPSLTELGTTGVYRFSYTPAAAGVHTFVVTAASCLTVVFSIQVRATERGDTYSRIGAPAGASIAADLAALPTDADVQTAAAAALTAYDPPTAAELTSGLAGLNDLSSVEAQAAAAAAITASSLDEAATRTLLALPAVAPAANGGLPTSNSANQVRALDGSGNAIAPASTALSNATFTDARAGYLDKLNLGSDTVATAANQTTILNRLGAWTGTGINTILGAFKALLSKAASAPSDIGGTFDPAYDSTEAVRDRGDAEWITATGFEASGAAAAAVGTLNDLSAQEVRDAMKLAPSAGDPAEGSLDALIGDIEAGSGLTAQEVRDAMKLAPTAGDPAAGSVDAHLDSIDGKTTNLPASPAATGAAMTLTSGERTAIAKALVLLDMDQADCESAGTTTIAALLALLDGWHEKATTKSEDGTVGTTTVKSRTGGAWLTVTYPLTTDTSYPTGVTPPA